MTTETTTTLTAIERSELTGTYTIDPAHSRFGFVARHAMVTKVRGNFNEFEGSLELDGEEPTRSSGQITIQAKSIDTRSEDRDAHLRSNDFFAMDGYPEIRFESTGIEDKGDDTYQVTGDLTIRGETRSVTFDVEFTGAAIDPWGNTRIGMEGSTKVNRKDWGVNWNAALEAGGVLVSEKVTIEFEIAAVKS
ncbi:MAG TPA: YceI family protein [Acidimicrobiia bacterium]|nr:YceI family protein [Acidimicrobiia bacterium]